MSTAELKILITFIYYALINGSLLAFSAVGNLGGGFFEELFIYLSCESTGIMLGKVRCERAFQRLELKIPLTAGLILVGLYPIVNLLYVLNIKEVKRWLSRRCQCCNPAASDAKFVLRH